MQDAVLTCALHLNHCVRAGASASEALEGAQEEDAFWSAAMPNLPSLLALSVRVLLGLCSIKALKVLTTCCMETPSQLHFILKACGRNSPEDSIVSLRSASNLCMRVKAACTAQVCRGVGEGRPSAADHPYHHMNERKRRKNPVNYADEPVVDGLRHAPKRKKVGGAKQGDAAPRWSQGPMPAPVLVIARLLTHERAHHHNSLNLLFPLGCADRVYSPQCAVSLNAVCIKSRLSNCRCRPRSSICYRACLHCWRITGKQKPPRMLQETLRIVLLKLLPILLHCKKYLQMA